LAISIKEGDHCSAAIISSLLGPSDAIGGQSRTYVFSCLKYGRTGSAQIR
jgi:hypothetical protein